jgi:O-antigen ligase
MLIAASRPVGRWFDVSSLAVAEGKTGSPLDQLVLGVLMLLALIVVFKRGLSLSTLWRDVWWLLLLLAYMGMSVLWSDYTAISLKRWIKVVGTLVCGLVILTEGEPLRAVEVILRRTAYTLIPFSIVLAKYFPEYGVDYSRWSGTRLIAGVCSEKNGLGLLCAVSAVFLIWDLLRRRREKRILIEKRQTAADVMVLIMAVYLLAGADAGTYSATSILVLLIGAGGVIALSRLRKSPGQVTSVALMGGLAVVVLVGGASLALGSSPMRVITSMLGRNESLTGRTDIWDLVFQLAPRWSLVGTGIGAFWGLPFTWELIEEVTGHNGYVDLYVELGAIGLLLLAVLLISLWRRFAHSIRVNFDWSVLSLCYLVVSIFYNVTESDYLSASSPLWTLLVFSGIACSGVMQQDSLGESESMDALGQISCPDWGGRVLARGEERGSETGRE